MRGARARDRAIGRREVVALLGAAIAWPGSARAQRTRLARIGYLSAASPPDATIDRFRAGMAEQGYDEGFNYLLEVRYAGRDYGRFPTLVRDLVAAKVDLIDTAGPASRAAPLAAQSVPVVFAFSGDPVDAGIVASLARPGGNATGVSMLQLDLASKRVELLKEAAPAITRVAILANPDHAGVGSELKATREAAQNLGLATELFEPTSDESFPPVLEAVARSQCDSLVTFPDALTLFNSDKIIATALRRRTPSIFAWKNYARAGGLISYGPVQGDALKRLAFYVDRILKGAKPADLPVQQPTTFELVVNLKTAKAIGLAIPPTLLARADEVIE